MMLLYLLIKHSKNANRRIIMQIKMLKKKILILNNLTINKITTGMLHKPISLILIINLIQIKNKHLSNQNLKEKKIKNSKRSSNLKMNFIQKMNSQEMLNNLKCLMILSNQKIMNLRLIDQGLKLRQNHLKNLQLKNNLKILKFHLKQKIQVLLNKSHTSSVKARKI